MIDELKNIQPETLIEASKEEIVKILERCNEINDELMQIMTQAREELMARLTEENKDGEVIGEYAVSRVKRITFKTSFEEAQELGAVKQEVDTTALRKMFDKGITIPGVAITYYLSARKMKDGKQK